MMYAEVSVNSPAAQRRTFSYAIPSGLNVSAGDAVWVPFGEKVLQGVVMALSPTPAVEDTRDIIDVIEPLLPPAYVSLARWISEYYLSPLFDAVALMLPPGFERRMLTFVQATGKSTEANLSLEEQRLLDSIRVSGRTELRSLERTKGKKRAQTIVTHLVKLGLLQRSYELEPIKVGPKTEHYLRLKVTVDEARQEAAKLKPRSAKQSALLEFLALLPQPVAASEIRKVASAAIVKALVSKGLAEMESVEVRREPISYQNIVPSAPLKLTAAQELAFKAIREELSKPKGKPSVFLLHGVTGSGKTEVYLRSLAEAVRLGKRGIVLVPEIALTPQTIERFAARFPHRVAVIHSQLSLGEQFDEWQRIKKGEFDVVIGPRSALFAPQPDLGLIVIDEEHEWTYKQSDQSPRYHTRTAALKLAELTGAVVVLGSATPDVESYYHATKGDYRLLQLPERVTPVEGAPLPGVEIVSLKDELKAGNRGVFSRALTEATAKAVSGGEQVILFLNRRGSSTFVQCRACGYVMRCKRCDIALTYHSEGILTCHQCNYRTRVPMVCPRCSSPQIKFLGIGTQKLEQETANAFPDARRLRWDSDVTRESHSHEEILNKFRSHDADILIGTQMVAKGLDLPLVTLVGVIVADTSLNLPDFRAGEKTFQLLSQVAGRAGRGVKGGRVIIQTYSPEHYAVQAAARHDYRAFYEKEIAYRRQLNNPPFSQLALLVYSHANSAICQKEAEKMRDRLTAEKDAKGIGDMSLIGPAPAFFQRLRGRYRWQLIVRGSNLSAFLADFAFPHGWTVDVDPVSVV